MIVFHSLYREVQGTQSSAMTIALCVILAAELIGVVWMLVESIRWWKK